MAKRRPANRLRVLRADQDITQLTLARKARVNVTRVSFIENGLVEPRPEEREKLAKALRVSVAELFPEVTSEAAAS
jgi:transcriptional regulator with XRE-family HTH domain